MYSKNNLIVLLTLLLSVICHGQGSGNQKKIDLIIEEVEKNISAFDQIRVDVRYDLFPSSDGKLLIESYDGLFVKDGENLYQKINNTEFFYSKGASLKVNHDQKMAAYSNNSVDYNNIFDLDLFLKLFPERNLSQNDGIFTIEMTSGAVTTTQYSKIVIQIRQSDYQIVKQVLHFNNQLNSPDKDGKFTLGYPRLEIILLDQTKDILNFSTKLSYLNTINKDRGIVALKGDLAKYELIEN